MSKPIRPDEIGNNKAALIPAAVFDAFNAEITLRFDEGSAQVMQDAVVRRLVDGGMNRSEIFSAGWLNVEDAYREAGWRVTYQKPGFNEVGEAFFTFSR